MESSPVRPILLPADDFAELRFQALPELIYLPEGEAALTAGDAHYSLAAQDVLIIPAYQAHTLTLHRGIALRYLLNMPRIAQIYGLAPGQTFACNSARRPQENYDPLRRAVAYFALLALRGAQPRILDEAAGRIVTCLLYDFLVSAPDAARTPGRGHVRTAIAYMQAHYPEKITVAQVAAACYITQAHLAHLFRQALGQSPSNYLTALRLNRAAELLQTGGRRLTDVAEAAGFGDVRGMNAAFRAHYGLLPKQWLAAQQTRNASSAQALGDLLERQARVGDGETHPVRWLQLGHVDVRAPGQLVPENLFGLLSIGPIRRLQKPAYREQLRALQRRFSFRIGVIWDLFAPEVIAPGTDGVFPILDSALDFLRELELQPLLVLSPEQARADRTQAFFRLLQARYGAALRQWRCAVTPEPGPPAQMLGHYRGCCRSIRALCPELQIGSPWMEFSGRAAARVYRNVFLEAFVHDQPDFYFFSYLPVRDTSDGDLLVDQRGADFTALRATLRRPVYLLWNSAPPGDLFHDTAFKAAHLPPALLHLAPCAVLGYGTPCDESSQPFSGQSGLLTRQSLPKASYFAYDFLHRLGGEVLLETENAFLTRNEDRLQLLLWNNQNCAYRLRTGSDGAVSGLLADGSAPLWAPGQPRHAALAQTWQQISLTLRGLTPARYRCTEQVLRAADGCAYSRWSEMGRPDLRQATACEYLRRVCLPRWRTQVLESTDGLLLLQRQMEPNEVRLIELSPEP